MPNIAARVQAAQKALRKAVTSTVKQDKAAKAQKALENAADAILAVGGAIPQADWDGLWRAYLAAQTAPDHDDRVARFGAAEAQAEAMLRQARAHDHHETAVRLLLASH